jgi:hypothetical protein
MSGCGRKRFGKVCAPGSPNSARRLCTPAQVAARACCKCGMLPGSTQHGFALARMTGAPHKPRQTRSSEASIVSLSYDHGSTIACCTSVAGPALAALIVLVVITITVAAVVIHQVLHTRKTRLQHS